MNTVEHRSETGSKAGSVTHVFPEQLQVGSERLWVGLVDKPDDVIDGPGCRAVAIGVSVCGQVVWTSSRTGS